MSIDTVDTLLDVLRRVQLLSPEQADEVARELAPHYSCPERLGEYLVEVEWLTAYQLQLLLAGQWDDLLIGSYQILDRLGEGGVSEVFKAWDTLRGRLVALKVLRQHLAGHSELVHQLQCELHAITRLSHPNVIRTFDAQREGEFHYFAMEYVEGMDLDRFVREVGPLSVEQACDFARQVAQGLQHAHQVGLVHRDIKPANLFLLHPPLPTPAGFPARRGPDPVVKIIDWGLARCTRNANDNRVGSREETDATESEKKCLIGTADYVAPEQAQDPTLADIRADVYSLGCTLYFLLTGQPPFSGPTLMQKLLQHQEATPPSLKPTRPDVPDELDALVKRMLAKNPTDRFSIPLLLVAPLRRFMTGGAGLSRPVASAPGTALNLPRPGTQTNLQRPGTHTSLARPGVNGNGKPAAHS
jgi:serine/threonine protein kinase